MPKLLAATALTVSLMFVSGAAHCGVYPLGDEPYQLDWGYDPEIQSGCWKWNWQLQQFQNYCPVYVHPKAYMYPRARAVVVRAKG